MSIRVYFRSPDGASSLSCPINPLTYDPQDYAKINELGVLHGSSIWQKKIFDDAIRILVWDKFDITDNYMKQMEGYFREHEGEKQYIKFNTLEDINSRWPSEASTSAGGVTYSVGRIISFEAKYARGSSLKYDYFAVKIQPEEP